MWESDFSAMREEIHYGGKPWHKLLVGSIHKSRPDLKAQKAESSTTRNGQHYRKDRSTYCEAHLSFKKMEGYCIEPALVDSDHQSRHAGCLQWG